MTVTIGKNISSFRALRQLSQVSDRLGSVFERLSSGQRINRASDDAAGLSVASQLEFNVRVLNQAQRNINDGVSILSIADSTLGSAISILDRIEELAIQSANGSYSTQQRSALDDEAQSLRDEFHRILSVAEFNGKNIFTDSDSSLAIQAGTNSEGALNAKFRENVATESGLGTYTLSTVSGVGGPPGAPTPLDSGVLTSDFNGDGTDDIIGLFFGTYAGSGYIQFAAAMGDSSATYSTTDSGVQSVGALSGPGNLFFEVVDYEGDGDNDILYSFTSSVNGYGYLVNDGTGNFTPTGYTTGTGVTASGNPTTSTSGDFNDDDVNDTVNVTIVSNNIRLNINTQDTETISAAEMLELDTISLTSASGALSALSTISEARTQASNMRGRVGASMSRLESSLNVAQATAVESANARGRIMDADIAQESAELVRLNILQQTSAAILAQANLQPQVALSLLSGS